MKFFQIPAGDSRIRIDFWIKLGMFLWILHVDEIARVNDCPCYTDVHFETSFHRLSVGL